MLSAPFDICLIVLTVAMFAEENVEYSVDVLKFFCPCSSLSTATSL